MLDWYGHYWSGSVCTHCILGSLTVQHLHYNYVQGCAHEDNVVSNDNSTLELVPETLSL